MSITSELAAQFKDSPAIVCCRTTKGTVISSKDLEDPSIFPDMEESGLITVTPDTLTIGQVVGATLVRDVDGLTSLTAAMLDGVIATPKTAEQAHAIAPKSGGGINVSTQAGVLHIEAQQIVGLNMTLPLGALSVLGGGVTQLPGGASQSVEPVEDKVLGTLVKREFSVKEVKLGKTTSFEKGVLTIRENLVEDALKAAPLVKKLEMDVITPDKRHVFTNTIMDVIPVATKVSGELGEGETNILNDMVFILTGIDE
ncbi:MAG: hypothetical protein LBT14_04640, partial [Treponema sp.]|nr:hypothetical protein [Treponema sp.]